MTATIRVSLLFDAERPAKRLPTDNWQGSVSCTLCFREGEIRRVIYITSGSGKTGRQDKFLKYLILSARCFTGPLTEPRVDFSIRLTLAHVPPPSVGLISDIRNFTGSSMHSGPQLGIVDVVHAEEFKT